MGDSCDNCRGVATTDITDTDGDRLGDVCDLNDDNDGFLDDVDNCPKVFNQDQADSDGDGLGDLCDDDIDGDGVENDIDNCPLDENTDQLDVDSDGRGDVCDPPVDEDGDGVEEPGDNCPHVSNPSQSTSTPTWRETTATTVLPSRTQPRSIPTATRSATPAMRMTTEMVFLTGMTTAH